MKKIRAHKLLLLLIFAIFAVLSNTPPSDDQIRAEAVDAFLETVPGPVVLFERGQRSVVFMNSVFHPEVWVDYARKEGLPQEMMVEVFELKEGGPLPSEITNAELFSEETFFQNGMAREETSMVVTPIALSADRDQAFFGSFYIAENGLIIVLVLMERSLGQWRLRKLAQVH